MVSSELCVVLTLYQDVCLQVEMFYYETILQLRDRVRGQLALGRSMDAQADMQSFRQTF